MASGEASSPDPMDAGAYDWECTDDPIEVLLAEHRTILQVLDEVERECRRVEAQAVLREAFWLDLLRFADEFDTRLHHEKEERILFPALEQRGLSPTSGPTAVLRDEHLRIHHWQARIAEAITRREKSRLAAATAHYVDVVRSHVLKENQILFPLARRLIPADELARMHREFRPLAADQSLRHWLRHPYPLGA